MVTTKYKVQKMFPFLVVRFWWLSFSLHVLCVLCMRVCLCLGQLINMNEMKLPKNFHTITHYAPPTYTHISHIVLPVGFQVDCKIRKRTPHAHTHINGPHSSRLCVCMCGGAHANFRFISGCPGPSGPVCGCWKMNPSWPKNYSRKFG